MSLLYKTEFLKLKHIVNVLSLKSGHFVFLFLAHRLLWQEAVIYADIH